MEHEFKPPTPEAAAPPPAPGPERAKRPPKKEKSPPTEKPAKTPEGEQNPAEKPPKRKFGARVLNLLFSRRSTEAPPPPTAESEPPAESDLGPTTERAGRMRRFARRVISFTRGEAAAETTRAHAEGRGTEPLSTEPLIDAAEDLRQATDTLDDTLQEAEETLVYQRTSTPESSSSPDFGGSRWEYPTSENIVKHVERLEAKVGASSTVSLAALGLGVLAVLIAGNAYFAGKRTEKTVRKSGQAQKVLENQVKAQQQEFVALQKEQAATMDRTRRQDYYQRLSEFTHQQAVSTREVHKELQHTIELALPVPEPLPPIEKPSPTLAPEQLALPAQPEPLRRVETADTVERGGQTGNAGTGFFGGGMSGIGGRIQQALGTATGRSTQPMTEQEISAEARRRARLASNAWLYSAGFVVAVAGLVLSLIFSS